MWINVAPSQDIRLAGADGAQAASLTAAWRGVRELRFETHGWRECTVHDRCKLPVGARFAGHALIEERESTCAVGADATVGVDAVRNMVVELP